MIASYDVQDFTWAHTAVEAENESAHFSAGASCLLKRGGSVQLLGTDAKFGDLLQ